MLKQQLLLKYKDRYICSILEKEYDFIQVPNYFYVEDIASTWSNISIFISLLLSGNITEQYESIDFYSYFDWEEIFYLCDFSCLHPIDENICLYDIDEFIGMNSDIHLQSLEATLERFSDRLQIVSLSELEKVQSNWLDYKKKRDSLDISEKQYGYQYVPRVSSDLLEYLRKRHNTVTDYTALLLYSGGKDSTLSAVRLRKQGYYVDFLHFNNGYMLDSDKPYLTFKKTFAQLKGYHFPYELSNVDIKSYFMEYFSEWRKQYGDVLQAGSIHSEIRCLSCRMAMYTKALEIAKKGNYKILAEGARISQKFMLEQLPMIERLQDIGKEFGIEMSFPVLDLVDDDEEKRQLITAGFSSKGWESKCLLGRSAMDKTLEDENRILEYYDNILKPKVLKNVRQALK